MLKMLSGQWVKLRDRAGKYIGMLMIPNEAVLRLQEGERREIGYCRVPGLIAFPADLAERNTIPSLQRFLIVVSHYDPNSVFLVGIEPEEISEEREFAFVPGPGYQRASAVEMAQERKPPSAGTYLSAAREVAG